MSKVFMVIAVAAAVAVASFELTLVKWLIELLTK